MEDFLNIKLPHVMSELKDASLSLCLSLPEGLLGTHLGGVSWDVQWAVVGVG